MAGRRLQVPDCFAGPYAGYVGALADAPLDEDTRRAYDSRIRQFLAWLAAAGLDAPDPLTDPRGRDVAARGYQAYLRGALQRSASTEKGHLTALDHFYEQRGLGRVQVPRDESPRRAPRPLDPDGQEQFLQAVQRRRRARDRAIGLLEFYAGLQVSEVAALNLADVTLAAGKGQVVVRSPAGTRTVPLMHPAARAAIAEWKAERAEALRKMRRDRAALFLNRHGDRLSVRAIAQINTDLAADAGLVDEHGRPDASGRRIRQTFTANLAHAGAGAAVIGKLTGRRLLDTTQLGTPPTREDLEAAVANLSPARSSQRAPEA